MFNRRGEFVGTLFAIIIIVAVALVVIYAMSGPGSTFALTLENMPEAIQKVFTVYHSFFSPIIGFVFNLVKPTQFEVNSNGAMIAFGIFLIFIVVGTKALNSFFRNGVISFIISFVLGLIASRSLTDEILNDALLQASPLAAVFFIAGIAPLLMINWLINRAFPYNDLLQDGTGQYDRGNAKKMLMKLGLYMLLIVIYYFTFERYFDASRLGAVYAVAIGVFAIGDLLLPQLRKRQERETNKNTGRFVAGWNRLFRRTKQVEQGANDVVSHNY